MNLILPISVSLVSATAIVAAMVVHVVSVRNQKRRLLNLVLMRAAEQRLSRFRPEPDSSRRPKALTSR